jgi:peptidyl-prolyl cis-trans isomerase SurA
MNLKDDYSRISQLALEEKKGKAMDKWLSAKIPTYYIMVAEDFNKQCPNVQKYTLPKAF